MQGLVIGASSGIGKAFLTNYGPQWDAPTKEQMDVRSRSDIEEFLDRNGPYTHVVFSAGVNHLEWLGKTAVSDIHHVIGVNLTGFIIFLDTLVAYQPNTPVRMVVVGSDAAERPLRTSIAYCASKAGLHQAVRVAARELGPKGWRINCVAPGMTDNTCMQEYVDARVQEVRGWSEEHMRAYEDQQAVVPGRLQPVEVAQTIHQTLNGPDHLNGSIITLNGGR